MKQQSRAKQVDVTVTPRIRQNKQVYCEIDAAGSSNKNVKGGVIKLPDEEQDYQLTFNLEDGDVPGLEFAAAPFSSDGAGCPAAGSNDPQFSAPQVKPGSNKRVCTVRVRPKKGKNVVHYSLHFTNGDVCDPIIINGKT